MQTLREMLDNRATEGKFWNNNYEDVIDHIIEVVEEYNQLRLSEIKAIEYNRGYVDCAKRFSGESLKPAPNE